MDVYKKDVDAKNKVIKKLMAEEGLEEKEVEGWEARYSVRVSESYNEEAMLEYMHKHKEFADCIRTKEYIDEAVLEDLIYKGAIPKNKVAALGKFRVTKETEVLTIKRVKA